MSQQNFCISPTDRVMLLGSCFALEIGKRMAADGFDVMINPFGTIFNPASIASAVARLDSSRPFTPGECVSIGAGDGRICSFSHYTKFARPSVQEFLDNANLSLERAAEFWRACNKVVITLGTAFVWEHENFGIVSNCLKRNAAEFRHYRLDVERCAALLESITVAHPEKDFLLTVSPIRHLAQGAHENTLSKATLHLAIEKVLSAQERGKAPHIAYFPAWEIMMDELRDYSNYSSDGMHPSEESVDYIYRRFIESAAALTLR